MNLPTLQEQSATNKKVILRADLDVKKLKTNENERLKNLLPTLSYLSENKAKTVIIGHRGRTGGEVSEKLSLKPVAEKLREISGKNIDFIDEVVGEKVKAKVNEIKPGEFLMLENLRFDKREEENDEGFTKSLASFGEVYVNDAFSVSHRKHSSIVSLPKLLQSCIGFHFSNEIKHLEKVLNNPKNPVVFVISGIKQDKINFFEKLEGTADKILVAGRLPEYIHDTSPLRENVKYVIGRLMPDKEDITVKSIEKFEKEISSAGTIIVSGPMGKFEEEGHQMGTKRVLKAVSNSDAFKVAGGGNTEAAITKFSLEDKFDWISTGGGAMLEFLSTGTLLGLIALSKDVN